MPKLIGGFLPVRVPGNERPDSVLAHWRFDDAPIWTLRAARLALRALWAALRPPTIWLPSYVCAEVANSVPPGSRVRYFDVGRDLLPDLSTLERELAGDDHVLAIDYFGRPAGQAFVELVQGRRDVGWIQDCAQALEGHLHPWGDWLLYSPRKLLGVPDGGILVGRYKQLPPLRTSPIRELAFMRAPIERMEDLEEQANHSWYARYVESERGIDWTVERMSMLSLELLSRTSIDLDRIARRSNYEVLRRRLSRWAFLGSDAIDFTPMGFPVQARNAEVVSKALADQGIFAPRHWAALPSPRERFPVSHALAQSLLTLPCDYRYNERDMNRLADAVEPLLQDHARRG